MSSTGIRLVLDQGVPQDAAVLLRDAGYNCTHVGEVGMFRAEDIEILSWAREHESIVVTLDADFHAILAVSRASSPSVIRLRIQGLNAAAVVALVQRVLVPIVSDPAFPWQKIFEGCDSALCLCGFGSTSKRIGLPNPLSLGGRILAPGF